jgi:hypothetical protein
MEIQLAEGPLRPPSSGAFCWKCGHVNDLDRTQIGLSSGKRGTNVKLASVLALV